LEIQKLLKDKEYFLNKRKEALENRNKLGYNRTAQGADLKEKINSLV
jgi:hypothetical protein